MMIEIPQNTDTSQYKFKMLKKNKIPGVLSCKERMEDGIAYLYADISQKRSLLEEFKDKELQLENMIQFFQELTVILDEIRPYLFHESMVNLDPEYIFKDREDQHLYVLILPWHSEEKTLHKLAEFFLEKINHKDENGVNAAYHFYRQQSQTHFSIYQFLSVLEKESILKRQKIKDTTETQKNSVLDKNEIVKINSYSYEEEEVLQKENYITLKNMKKGTGVLALIFFILGILPMLSIFIKISCISFSILFIFIFIILHFRKEKVELKESLPLQEMEIDMKETVFFNSYEEGKNLKLEWKERGRKKQYILEEFPCIVGKIKEEVSLLIADSSVSRVHCKFVEVDHKICIMDMNSTNGTFLNGLPVKSGEIQEIEKNDEILVGKVKISVV